MWTGKTSTYLVATWGVDRENNYWGTVDCSGICCHWRCSSGDFEGSRCQMRQCTCKITLCIFNSDHQIRRSIWNATALLGGHWWYKWTEDCPWRMWDRTQWNSELWPNTSYPSMHCQTSPWRTTNFQRMWVSELPRLKSRQLYIYVWMVRRLSLPTDRIWMTETQVRIAKCPAA